MGLLQTRRAPAQLHILEKMIVCEAEKKLDNTMRLRSSFCVNVRRLLRVYIMIKDLKNGA